MAQMEFVLSGEIDLLEVVRQYWNSGSNFVMRLFTATTDPDHDTASIADFTEASFAGYSEVVVSNWDAPTHGDPSQHAVTSPATDPGYTNSSGSSQPVKGIFVVSTSGAPTLIGWGYFLSTKADVTIPDASTLNVAISVNLQTLFENS